MTNRAIPYTSDDLRAIADNIDEIVNDLGDLGDLGDWRWGLTVEIYDPEVPESVVGHIKAHPDGWFGFYPVEATD